MWPCRRRVFGWASGRTTQSIRIKIRPTRKNTTAWTSIWHSASFNAFYSTFPTSSSYSCICVLPGCTTKSCSSRFCVPLCTSSSLRPSEESLTVNNHQVTMKLAIIWRLCFFFNRIFAWHWIARDCNSGLVQNMSVLSFQYYSYVYHFGLHNSVLTHSHFAEHRHLYIHSGNYFQD